MIPATLRCKLGLRQLNELLEGKPPSIDRLSFLHLRSLLQSFLLQPKIDHSEAFALGSRPRLDTNGALTHLHMANSFRNVVSLGLTGGDQVALPGERDQIASFATTEFKTPWSQVAPHRERSQTLSVKGTVQ